MTTPSPAPISASQASAANGEALPGWPELRAYQHEAQVLYQDFTTEQMWQLSPHRRADYNEALAAYWEARARLAVEALRDISSQGIAMQSRCTARETLAAIGDLPPSPKEQRT